MTADGRFVLLELLNFAVTVSLLLVAEEVLGAVREDFDSPTLVFVCVCFGLGESLLLLLLLRCFPVLLLVTT